MAKTKKEKEEVAKVEEEVFGAESAPEVPVETPAETPAETPVKQSSDEFPESVPVLTSEWGVPVFQVVQDGKGNARIYGKRGEPVSGVIPATDAARQASRHNAMDPEQLEAKSRKRK